MPEITICDSCAEAVYADLETCEHGETRCAECGLCRFCSVEERRP